MRARDRRTSAKPQRLPAGVLGVFVRGFLMVLAGLLLSGRPAAGQSIEVESWLEARASSFLLRSNAAPERVEEIAQTLVVFRAAFARLAPDLELRSPVPTRILAFRDEESFASFKSGQDGRGGRILGQFLTHPDGNFITMNADPRLLGGVGVILHEYVHFLVSHNFLAVPRWFNEGLAEYYSTFAVEGDRAVIGRPVGRHLDWLRRNGRLDLREILETESYPGRHSEVDAGHFYAVSWGLVHYLMSSPGLAANLADYFFVEDVADPVARFEDVFELRLEDLEAELERYLLGDGPPAGSVSLEGLVGGPGVSVAVASEADVLTDLGALLVRLGDEIAAARMFDLALAYEPGHGDAYAGLAHARDIGQRFEEADVLFAEALERDLDDPRSYVLLGRHLMMRLDHARRTGEGDVAGLVRQAEYAFRAATELMSDYAEAWALRGALHLQGQLEAGDGVPHLERALELLPGRVDLFFQLLQLELRRGGEARARRLADGPIRRLGGEEWGLRADEEIERIGYLRQADAAILEGRLDEGATLLEAAIAVTSDVDLRERLVANLERLRREIDTRQTMSELR